MIKIFLVKHSDLHFSPALIILLNPKKKLWHKRLCRNYLSPIRVLHIETKHFMKKTVTILMALTFLMLTAVAR